MLRKLTTSWYLCILAALIASCSGSTPNPTTPPVTSLSCVTGNKCSSGSICNVHSGLCEKITVDESGCSSDAQCDEGYQCNLESKECYDHLTTQVMTFEDDNLDKAVRAALEIDEGAQMTLRDCADLESLSYASNDDISLYNPCDKDGEASIQSLAGITQCPNLKSVAFSCNGLGNASLVHLSRLEHLESINLSYNKITSLAGLEASDTLVSLNLMGNLIDDIPNISRFPNVRTLKLFTEASDLFELSKLIELKSLRLAAKNATDVTPLSSLTKLQSLELYGSKIQDITALSTLTDLDTLRIKIHDDFADISVLSNLQKLSSLILWGHSIEDITPLQNLTKIDYLDLGKNNIQSIDALVNMTALYSLSVRDNPIGDIAPIKTLVNKGAFTQDGVVYLWGTPDTEANTAVKKFLKESNIAIDVKVE